jgi:hypothetical protein
MPTWRETLSLGPQPVNENVIHINVLVDESQVFLDRFDRA